MSSEPHDVLGVGADADEREIRRAYRSLLKETHPDKGGTREALERVQHAYALLCGQQPRVSNVAPLQNHPPAVPVVPRGRAALLTECQQDAARALDVVQQTPTLQAHDDAVAALLRLRGVQRVLGKHADARQLGQVLVSRAALQEDPCLALVDFEDAAACGVLLQTPTLSDALTAVLQCPASRL